MDDEFMLEQVVSELRDLLNLYQRYPEEQREQLLKFSEMVLDKNQYMNLTAIKDAEGFHIKHLEDSLTLLSLIDELSPHGMPFRMLDIGSGAGFPGIPLKILRPNIDMLLLDSLQKRVRFLEEVIEELQLMKIQAIHSRAEEAGRKKELREQFDVVTARAVAALPVLIELAAPFLKVGGHFWAMKAAKDELEESRFAAKELGLECVEERVLLLPNDFGQRVILNFKKVSKTKSKYPRKAGTPGKNPLIML